MQKLLAILLAGLMASCASSSHDAPPPELVMKPGTTLMAQTKAGTIVITATGPLDRTYTWEGASRSVTMWPRTERWYGSLGAYFPGPGEHWREHHGITRGVVEEGQQHFSSVKDALAWLKEQDGYYPTVYRDDGLAVSFSKTLERRQLNVNVWQLTIGGKNPDTLPGSRNEWIRLSSE